MKFDLKKYTAAANTFVSKYFVWLVVGVGVVIFSAGWFFLLQGAYFSLQETGFTTYDEAAQNLEDRQNYLLNLTLMESEFVELDEERLQQTKHLLPVGLEPTEVISNIQAFTGATGLTVLSIDVVKPEVEVVQQRAVEGERTGPEPFENKRIRTATVTMNVENTAGSYAELKRFLDALETFVPVMDLRNLSYTPDTSSFALQLQTYYLQEEEEDNDEAT
ncbi:hypothetical protein ACFL2M_00070 [Patescibacteria group bacterium]